MTQIEDEIDLHYHILTFCVIPFHVNPLKTSPEYTLAGVYGKCVLEQNQTILNGLKASFNNVFTFKNLSYMSLHAISVFDKV